MGVHRTDSIEAAGRWIAKLFDAFEAIARMRASGAGGSPGLCRLVGAYLIIYRARAGEPVEIVAEAPG